MQILGLAAAEASGPGQPLFFDGKRPSRLHVKTTRPFVGNSSSAMSSLVSRHTIRQVEYLLPGALVTYYYGTISEFLQILSSHSYGNLTHGAWLAR